MCGKDLPTSVHMSDVEGTCRSPCSIQTTNSLVRFCSRAYLEVRCVSTARRGPSMLSPHAFPAGRVVCTLVRSCTRADRTCRTTQSTPQADVIVGSWCTDQVGHAACGMNDPLHRRLTSVRSSTLGSLTSKSVCVEPHRKSTGCTVPRAFPCPGCYPYSGPFN